jgi:sulfate adenylyltransferase subunit 1 (EFTu-like GTPase family)
VDGRRADAARPALPDEDRHAHGRRTVTEPKYKVNVNTLEHLAAKKLELNEIGVCNLALDRPIAFDPTRTTARPAASS